MELTRENILKMEPGVELDMIVAKKVFGECKYRDYSSNIGDCMELIQKYHKRFLINYLTPYPGFSLGWHCNIRGIHVRGCKTPMEAICKAALLVELDLYEGSEIYQKEKYDIWEIEYEDYHTERFDELLGIIQSLETDKLYTKKEIKQRFGIK